MIQRMLMPYLLAIAFWTTPAPASPLPDPEPDAIEVVGSAAHFRWTPASGPVAGYRVYVRRSNGVDELHGLVLGGETRETVSGDPGDTIRVSVAAIDADGNEGPRSPLSQAVQFAGLPPVDLPAPLDGEAPAHDSAPSGEAPAGNLPPVEAPAPAEVAPPADLPPPDEEAPVPGDGVPPRGDELPPVALGAPRELGGDVAELDFDGDGFSDILLRHRRTAETRVLAMERGAIAADRLLPQLSPDARVVGNDDYDGDGRADALWADPAGQLEVWLIRDGAVAARTALDELLPKDAAVVGSGDFDGDGDADLAVRNERRKTLEIWYLARGELGEILEITDAPGRGWRVGGTGDYTADGVPDILWYSRGSGEVVLWEFVADTVEETPLRDFRSGFKIKGIGDVDGDGRSDLLVRDRKTGALAVARVRAEGIGSPKALPGQLAGQRLRAVATGDFDGDGRTDLVVKDESSRQRRLLLMEGRDVAAVETLPELGPGWYEAGVAD